jgi:hypothetical protein
MSLAAILFGFPTAIFTVLLGLMLVYWVFVILGALDLDFLGGGEEAAAGAVKGALEGATKGALDGATKGMLDGATKGMLDGATHGALDLPDADGALASFVSALNLKHVPVTIVLSIFALFGWLASSLAMQQLAWRVPLPAWLFAAIVLVVSTFVGLVAASIGGRPFARVFRTHTATSHAQLVGKIAVVTTSKVSRSFGDARLEGGGSVTLQIRSDEPNDLKRGDRCMLVDWDVKTGAFLVERLPDSFPEARLAAQADAVAAREAAAEAEVAAEAEAEPGAEKTTSKTAR